MSEPRVQPKRAGVWENLGTSHVDLGSSLAPKRARSRGSVSMKRPRPNLRHLRGRMLTSISTTVVLLLILIALHAIDAFSELQLPALCRSPAVVTLLAVLVLFFAVKSYTDALRSLAFSQRFIRPGLRQLLEERGDSLYRGEKLFRGRKAVIMKVDMANYTFTTFDMPYGMRRLFQDLWFTLIDLVVADKVFFDKSLGDGSFYYFEDGLDGGSCRAALEAAVEIRNRRVHEFDRTFNQLLRHRLDATPELRAPADRYFEAYQKRAGASFWDRTTLLRIALISGYVDEGLWGLSSQSHYDAQGTVPILAARLEEAAGIGEIVLEPGFLDELGEDSPDLLHPDSLERRTLELKGIGPWEAFVLPPDHDPFG